MCIQISLTIFLFGTPFLVVFVLIFRCYTNNSAKSNFQKVKIILICSYFIPSNYFEEFPPFFYIESVCYTSFMKVLRLGFKNYTIKIDSM